jgi:hypothetical protein
MTEGMTKVTNPTPEAVGELVERDWLPFSVRNKVFHAICDPGSVVGERYQFEGNTIEHLANWQARAAIEAMRLAGWTRAALERPHSKEQG